MVFTHTEGDHLPLPSSEKINGIFHLHQIHLGPVHSSKILTIQQGESRYLSI